MTDILVDLPLSQAILKEFPEIINNVIILAILSHLFYFLFMQIINYVKKEKEIPDFKKINETCSIGLESIQYEAKLLCSHSYCFECIISYGKQRFNLHNIECPMCRRASKLIFCQFEKNIQNKEIYQQILNYNYALTSSKATLCLSYDIVIFAKYYYNQMCSSSRLFRKREISILFCILIFFTILFPLSLKISDNFELIEDIVFYLSLIVIVTEIFYRNLRIRINAEYLSIN
jgi:hypothetical protein